jgi:hypothetical protein
MSRNPRITTKSLEVRTAVANTLVLAEAACAVLTPSMGRRGLWLEHG